MDELTKSYIQLPLTRRGVDVNGINNVRLFKFYAPPVKDGDVVMLKNIMKNKIVAKLNGVKNVDLRYTFKYKDFYIWMLYGYKWRKILYIENWNYLTSLGLTAESVIRVNNTFGNWMADTLNSNK